MYEDSDRITVTQTRLQCRHVFTDGHRCGSPCLRNEQFCYFHHTTRRPARRSRRFRLNAPEDRSAIQLSVGQILQRLADNSLDPKRAALLLYALQIASNNLPRPTAPAEPDEPASTVVDITVDPRLGTLAAITECPAQKLSTADLLLKRWEQQRDAIKAQPPIQTPVQTPIHTPVRTQTQT